MKALNKNNAVESLHQGDVDSEPLFEQEIEAAVSTEKHHHGYGADKGRHNKRNDSKTLDNDSAFKLKA